MEFTNEPISNITWLDTSELSANDYNPNVVLGAEMKLLKLSLLTNGWIQPILVTKDLVIIDGYHRYWLSSNDDDMKAKYKRFAPCVILD